MKLEAINIKNKFEKFESQWMPHVIAELNDYQFRIARLEGEFVWHDHKDSDEVFIIIEGELSLELRDGIVHLKEGEMFVIPKGVEHKPVAKNECKIMLVEPRGLTNTGDNDCDFTVKKDVWI